MTLFFLIDRLAEGVRDKLALEGVPEDNTWIPAEDLGRDLTCLKFY
jgi:hypothetical protein